MDIHQYQINGLLFMNVNGDMNELSFGAKILLKIHERLLLINEDKDINGSNDQWWSDAKLVGEGIDSYCCYIVILEHSVLTRNSDKWF